MERIASRAGEEPVRGDAAIDRWLYFTEVVRGKIFRRPRYVLAFSKKIIPWNSDLPRDDASGLPKGTAEPTRDELLRHVIQRIRKAEHPAATSKAKLARAIAETPAPPCIKFSCPKQEDCATRRLACYAFWWWSGDKNRRAISPWAFVDYHVRPNGDASRRKKLVWTDEPIATRGMFNEIFSERDQPIGRPPKKKSRA